MRDLAFLGLWLILPLLCLQGAQFGVMVWAWTSLLAPNDVLYGIGAAVPFAKIAAGITLLTTLIGRGGNIRLSASPTVLLMIALGVLGLLSQYNGAASFAADGWDLYSKYAKILLLAVLVTAVMRDRLRLHGLLIAICLGLCFTGVGEGAKFLLSGGGHKVLGTASTGDNNQIGLDVLLIMPLLWYLKSVSANKAFRLGCWAALAGCAVCIIATASRAAFIGLCILGLALILGSRRKLTGLALVAILAIVGLQFVGTDWKTRMNTIGDAQSDTSFMGRVQAWKISTALALNRPLLGGGFHAIQHGDVWVAERQAAIALPPDAIPPLAPRAAHSIYFEILGDLGFTGLALFLALFAVAVRNTRRVRRLLRQTPRPDLAWAASLAGCVQASLIVFLIAGASLSAAYYDIDYLLVAIAACLRELVERELRPGALPVDPPSSQAWGASGPRPAFIKLAAATLQNARL